MSGRPQGQACSARTSRATHVVRLGAVTALLTTLFVLPLTVSSASAASVPTCGSGGTPSVIALADPSFYIDSSAGLDATYAGYTVRAGSAAENSLWLSVGGFVGGVVTLAPGQPADVALPNIPAGSSATSYLLLTAAAETATPQAHTITLYRGHPSAGDAVCTRTFSYNGVHEAIKALANKVTSVTATSPGAEAHIGDTIAVSVQGKTGTLGAGPTIDPGVLSYAPNALSGFPAGAWRLEKTTMTISPDGVAPAQTYVNRLYLAGASGPDRPYTAEYLFRAIGPADGGSGVQPVQYIASGTQVKHTDIGGSVIGSLPAVSRDGNVTLDKTASTDVVAATGGTVTYTVTATNLGGSTSTIDRLVDTLPTDATYVLGTSALAGRALDDPEVAGRQLTWSGPITVPAGASLALEYSVTLPATAGSYVNAAIAYYGNATYDSSRDVTLSNPATATVRVLDAGGSARAQDDTATTTANEAVVVDVLANDSSTGGFPLSVAAVGTPAHGSTSLRPGGTVAYTPTSGFAGVDTFTYTLSDGYSTATGTVTVTVTPTARADAYVTAKSTTLNGTTVLANDACTGCTVSLVSGPATGTLSLSANGTFTYSAPNQNGTATFTYRATTSGTPSASATATVTIYVNAAGPDYATTPYDTDVTIAVTTNDTCPGGGNCNISAGTNPAHGAVTYSGTNITYNPANGFWGLDSFTYSLNGGAGATVTLLVAPPSVSMTTTFDTAVTADIDVAAFTGVATVNCSGCLYAVTGSPTHGTLVLGSTTAAFTYTPDEGAAGSDSFTYNVTDPATGLNVSSTVTLTVGPDAADDSFIVLVRQSTPLSVLDNDACPSTCTVSIEAESGPSSGTVSVNPDNTITFSTAPAHDIGVVTFRYRVSTSLAPSVIDTATVTVAVEGAVDDTATTSPGQSIAIDVRGNDPCTDCTTSGTSTPTAGTAAVAAGDGITYTAPASFSGTATFTYDVTKNGHTTSAAVTVSVLPEAVDDDYATTAGTTIELDPRTNDLCVSCVITAVTAPSGGGSATIDGDGQAISFQPGVAAGGSEHFDYTVRDTDNHTTSATVTVTVNAPPVAVDDLADTDADTPVVIDVAANDTCPGCEVNVSSDPTYGTVALRADGRLQYAPAPRFSGLDGFRYLVTDPATGLSSEASVTVTVHPAASGDTADTTEGGTVTVDVLANDSCTACTVTVVIGPTNGSALVHPDGTIAYTAPAHFEGTDVVGYRVTDPTTNETADAEVTVTVSNAKADSATTAYETGVDIDVLANDSCVGCALQSVATPAHGAAVIDAGAVRYDPAVGFWGLDSFTYATGTDGSVSRAAVTVLVAPPARSVVTGTGTPTSGDLRDDGSCNGCSFTIVNAAINGDITLEADGTWTYTPPDGVTPDEVVTYRVTDPVSGLTVTATLTISVRPSQITVDVSVVNDDGGTATTADVGVALNGTAVVAGVANDVPAAVEYTVSASLPAGYAASAVDCTDDDGLASVGHPFTLDAGQHVTCVVTADDLASTPDITIALTPGAVNDANADSRDDAGDTVEYSYLVTNTGAVALSSIVVTDDHIDPDTAIACATSGANTLAALLPGASEQCTATYTITQSDIDSGGVANQADVVGDASGTSVTDSDTATVTLTRESSLTTAKTFVGRDDRDDSQTDTAGDVLAYHVVATNTGTTTLTGVELDDPLTGGHVRCGALGPSVECALDTTYTLTQSDVDAGEVENTAVATGTSPDAGPVSDAATADVTLDTPPAALSITKTLFSEDDVDHSGDRNAGDVLTYDVTVTNVGGRVAVDVSVTDDLTNDSTTCSTVAPGATCTLRTEHTITLAEGLAGSVANTARATASNADSADTTLTLPVVHHRGLHVTAELVELDLGTVAPDARADTGDDAHYRYTVTNTGESALHDVALSGPLAAQAVCPEGGATIASLAAGQSVECLVTHGITQADIDSGTLDAGAHATGTTVDDVIVDASSALTTALVAAPVLTISKTVVAGTALDCDHAGHSAAMDAGHDLTWCFVVTNAGNVTLHDVAVVDALLGYADGSAQPTIVSGGSTLAPSQQLIAATTKTAIVSLINSASASATSGGSDVDAIADSASATVNQPPAPDPDHTVTGVVWFDSDHDGERGDLEPLLPGADVTLVPSAGPARLTPNAAFAAVSQTAVTGTDGHYAFTGVPDGSYVVHASVVAALLPTTWDSDGSADWIVTLTVAGGDASADFATTPGGGVTGQVTRRDNGAPIGGASLLCQWPGLDGVDGTADDVTFAAVTGSDGNYALTGVPAGPLSCAVDDPAVGSAAFSVAVPSNGTAQADAQLGAASPGGGPVTPPVTPPAQPPRVPSGPIDPPDVDAPGATPPAAGPPNLPPPGDEAPRSGTAPLSTTAPSVSGELARTGVDPWRELDFGLGFIIAGLIVLVWTRPRHRRAAEVRANDPRDSRRTTP